jgi:hypothetical protein
MTRRVFYSFDYQHDSWRAAMVRNIGVVQQQRPVIDNRWEEVKRGEDAAIKRWIDEQLRYRSCTVVLIGAKTASCRWIQYEIQRSLDTGKGLLGIRIHQLMDQYQQTMPAGPNPFELFTLSNGQRLSSHVPAYESVGKTSAESYAYISQHLKGWIETAIAARPIALRTRLAMGE